MKYKRHKTKVSKYISESTGKKNIKKPVLKKQIAAAFLLVTILYSLSAFGFVKTSVIKSIFSYTGGISKKISVASIKNSAFFKNAGEHIVNFCFGYLKNNDTEKTNAYADSKENKNDTPKQSSDLKEIKSDSHITPSLDAAPANPPEPEFLPLWPCVGSVTSEFGKRVHPVTGEAKRHNGVDIGAAEGSKIFACEDGTIDVATYNEYSGNYVVISHTDGYTSTYCHMSKLCVNSGDTVKKGDVIGLVGSTGMVTGPHLHFELKQNGTLLDPQSLISSQQN